MEETVSKLVTYTGVHSGALGDDHRGLKATAIAEGKRDPLEARSGLPLPAPGRLYPRRQAGRRPSSGEPIASALAVGFSSRGKAPMAPAVDAGRRAPSRACAIEY